MYDASKPPEPSFALPASASRSAMRSLGHGRTAAAAAVGHAPVELLGALNHRLLAAVPGSVAQRSGAKSKVLVGVWFVALVVVSGILLGRHLLALPPPAVTDDVFRAALERARLPADGDRLEVIHVLYSECRCSQRIAEQLEHTKRPEGVVETVLLVGDSTGASELDHEARLGARGFRVRRITPVELSTQWHIVAAPMFIVGDSLGAVRYVGGYTATKQGYASRDRELIEAARSGTVSPLPILGCAVAENLKKDLDPTGWL